MKKLLPLLGLIAVLILIVKFFPSSEQPSPVPSSGEKTAAAPDGDSVPAKPRSDQTMRLIPAGEFAMGSDDGSYDAKPAHRVGISAFYMDKVEVTQELYEKITGENPARWKNAKGPVEQVRWTDAVTFCNARSKHEGLDACYDLETWTCKADANGFRLPTEAEWEYACRAGAQTQYYFGNDRKDLGACVWYKVNARGRPQAVGRKRANAWGLHDMLGNVYEWCNDAYSPAAYRESETQDPCGPDPEEWEKRVLRGGCWKSSADKCRSWSRYCEDTGAEDECYSADHIGFRCVRRAPGPAPGQQGML